VFIPCFNESEVIIDTLKNILEIDYPFYKVWVLNDNSDDGTEELVKAFIEENKLQHKLALINKLPTNKKGKAASLNQALQMTEAPRFVVFDADAKIDKDCLRKSAKYFLDPKVGALQFQKKVTNASYNLLTKCQDLEFAYDTYLQLGRDSIDGFVELRGNGFIMTRECYIQVGKWNEGCLTEDLDMTVRIHSKGRRIKYAPEIVVNEEGVISPIALIKQRRRWGEGSLRRYLNHFHLLLGLKGKLSLLKKLDILPYLSQFAIPVWVSIDIVVELIRYFNGQQTYFTTLMIITFFVGVSLWSGICIGVHRWRDYSKLEALKYGTIAFWYGAVHWPPIVLWSMRKVLFGRRPTQWAKTPRMVVDNTQHSSSSV
ncbi:MAG TPA: glycosyltransferase family 2 protein, partial [Vampirovibrionales bacterium]